MKNAAVKNAAVNRIAALIQEIREHDHNYYVLATPTISDLEYDRKLRDLTDLESELRPLSAREREGCPFVVVV